LFIKHLIQKKAESDTHEQIPEWKMEDEGLEKLLHLVKKKKYPYPSADELRMLLTNITLTVRQHTLSHKLDKFIHFADNLYFNSKDDEVTKPSGRTSPPPSSTQQQQQPPASPRPSTTMTSSSTLTTTSTTKLSAIRLSTSSTTLMPPTTPTSTENKTPNKQNPKESRRLSSPSTTEKKKYYYY